MRTDPQNSDYVVLSGATRNFEPRRSEDEETDKDSKKRYDEEMGDAMKSLGNRTLDSKREMDILATLDEMKSMKSRHATVSVDAMLEALQRSAENKKRKASGELEITTDYLTKDRACDISNTKAGTSDNAEASKKPKFLSKYSSITVSVKKNSTTGTGVSQAKEEPKAKDGNTALQSLFQNYESD